MSQVDNPFDNVFPHFLRKTFPLDRRAKMRAATGLLGASVLLAIMGASPSWCGPSRSQPARVYFSGEDQLPLTQKLTVRQLSRRKIAFTMSSRVGSGPEFALSGTATEPGGDGDPELDDDEGKESYFVDAYMYDKGGCSLEIRIESETRRRATVLENGCGSKHPASAPFETKTTLKTRASPASR